MSFSILGLGRVILSAQPHQTPQLEAALWYASLGWSVVPTHRVLTVDGVSMCTCPAGPKCISKGKHPAVAWSQWQIERPSVEQITTWFTGVYAAYGVGIVTGAVSGIFVIDVDEGPGKPGNETITNVQMIHGDLPFTVQARTGGGGLHVILRHPRDIWVTTAKNVLGPGVDVRGDGGFIVASPSLHESGRYYLWDETSHPRTTPIADAPAWLVELIETPPPDAQGRRPASTGTGEIVKDAWGKVVDGRERHMVGIICGVIATHLRDCGLLPSVEAVLTEAWPSYERTTRARGISLEEDGRGLSLMRQRTGHFLRRAASGKWRVAPPFPESPAGTPPGQMRDIPSRPSRIRLLSLAELRALPPPEWLIHGLVPEKSLVVPYGPPKSGKTFIVLSAGLHIAAGMPWFGHAVKQGAVVYIAGEGTGGISIRVQAMCAVYGISEDVPFWVVPVAVNFSDKNAIQQLSDAIRATVGTIRIAMIVVDTLARAMPGADENSAQEVGLVIAACDGLKEEFECTVAPVHHEGKDSNRGARGTSALRGAWDAAFQIRTEGKRTTLIVTDQKEGESGQRLEFKMTEQIVGVGRTSLVPVLQDNESADDWQAPRRDPGGNTGLALQVLREAIAAEGESVPWFSGRPSGDLSGIRSETWRRWFYEKIPSLTQEARKKAFQRSCLELTRSARIGVRDPWIWLPSKNETGHGT